MSLGRVPVEQPAPTHQIEIHPWPDIERAFRIAHPAQAFRDHPRRCQRREMAGHDHPRVAHRAIIPARPLALDQRHRKPPFQRVVSRAQPDDSASHDDHPLRSHGHQPTSSVLPVNRVIPVETATIRCLRSFMRFAITPIGGGKIWINAFHRDVRIAVHPVNPVG